MNSKALITAGSLALMLGGTAFASLAVGSEPKDWPTNAARHVVSITRTAANDVEKKMIEAAENAAPTGTNTWCGAVQNNIKIPFALTKDALAYYETLIQGYQKKAFKTYCEPNSKMTYTATVTHEDSYAIIGKTYKNVHVVTLKLSFHANFTEDGTMGVQFEKERTVVVDDQGSVLAVSGDGTTMAPMLAI